MFTGKLAGEQDAVRSVIVMPCCSRRQTCIWQLIMITTTVSLFTDPQLLVVNGARHRKRRDDCRLMPAHDCDTIAHPWRDSCSSI